MNTTPQEAVPTEETIVEARLRVASDVERMGNRLRRFVSLNAPEIIIESERMLILRTILAFPVNAEAQMAKQRVNNSIYAKEQTHLMETGYYDDVMRDLDEPGQQA